MVALPNRALAGLAAAAGLATVQARTSQGDCDPIETDCAPFPAISAKVHCDLTKDDCEHIGTLEGRGVEVQNYDSPDGAEFTVESLGADDYLSIQTSLEYLLFGRVDVEIRTTPATGLETFLGLGDFFSSTVDISFRLRGAYKDEASLYFFANTDNFTDTKTIPDMTADFHTYSIDWTPDSVSWLVDDEQIWFVDRKPSSEDGKTYIERPLKVFMGIQISGRDGAGDAAISLVGGEADMAEAPFTSYFRNLTITDYGGGSNATKAKIKEYEATDNSGDIDSIKIVKEGDSSSNDDSKGDDGTGDDSKGEPPKGDTKPTEEASSSKSGGISRATAVGIAFGVFSLLVICGIAGYIFYHRRKMAQPRSSDTQPFMASTVNNHHEDPWVMGYHAPLEMDGTDRPQELDVRKDMAPVELAVPPRQLRD